MKLADLTIIILTRNCEATLQQTLDSCAFCEHILIADDHSSDRTLEIAKASGAAKVKLTRAESFAAKRNEAMQYAPTEWVLFVDSDEWISAELRQSILDFYATNKHTQYAGMRIKRSDFLFGKKLLHGETSMMWLTRLGQKSAGLWDRDVHEIWQIHGTVGQLDGEIYHAPHPTVESFFDKIIRYSKLEASQRVHKFQGTNSQSSNVLLFTACIQLLVYPPAKFMHNFVVKFGFVDGYRGLIMAWMMSLHSLCVRIQTIEILRSTERKPTLL